MSEVGDRSQGWPEGSLFNRYYTGVEEGATPFSGLYHFATWSVPYDAEC